MRLLSLPSLAKHSRLLSVTCVLVWQIGSPSYAATEVAVKTTPPSANKATTLILPKGVQAGPQTDGVSEYRLANGLKVLLFPDQSKPSTTVNMTYLVGSRHENYGETGMAHLLEHLMFKGTPKYSNISQQMAKRGMQFNGTTNTDRTNYYESFSASEENLQWALALEADRMVHSFIAKKDLDSEMTVVRNEYESGENSTEGVLIKRLFTLAYDWHNAGKPAIGNRSDIENVKIANLQNFYRQYYQPDNAVLTIAGKFDPSKTLAWIAKEFSAIPKPKRSLPKLWTQEPVQDGERSVIVRRAGGAQVVALAYKIPAALHADADALDVAVDILTNSPSGRLHKSLVESGKAAQVFGFTKSGIDPGLLVIAAVLKPGTPIEPVQAILIDALENFTQPSKEEIERFQRGTSLMFENALNDPQRLAVALSGAISLGDWRLFFKSRDDVANVNADQVKAASARYFKRDNRILASFIPEDKPLRADIPAAPSASEVLANFVPKAALAASEAFDPAQANIDARTKRIDIGGLKLALLPKQTRGGDVVLSMQLHWGDAENRKGMSSIGAAATSLLLRGAGPWNRQQLSDEMDKLKITGSPPFYFLTKRENLSQAVAMMCQVLKQPQYPESELQQWKQQQKVAFERAMSEPQALAADAMEKHFNAWPKDDVRAYRSMPEQLAELEKITVADLKKYHQEFFGASHGEIAVVGDFDAKQTESDLRKCLQTWPSKARYQRLENRNAQVAAVRQVINTPDKENAVYMARMNLDLSRKDADFAALMLANHMLGESGLSSRLAARVRQKDGLSYGIHSQLSAGELDRAGQFSIGAIVAPQNVRKLEAAVKDELEKLLRDGFSAEELAQAQSGMLQERRLRRTEDSTLAGGWTSLMYINKTYAYSAELDQQLQSATLGQVNQALRNKLKLDQLSYFIAVDAKKMDAAK